MRAASPALAALAIAASALAGCVPTATCDLRMVVTDDPGIRALPQDAEPVVTPADLDPLGWQVIPDDGSGLGDGVAFRLVPEARDRLAAVTEANVGRYLAVEVGGEVVSVPMIASSIPDGEVLLTGASDDAGFVERFRPCLPIELLPTG